MMNSELFGIGNFNVLQDNDYYYVFRALNRADHADVLNYFLETNEDIERIRTDRERYEEEHGRAKYNKDSELSLEEIYDHIKVHYLKETNCISLSTNANVSLDYGAGYFDEYAVIKVPKNDHENIVSAGQYMLTEISNRIEKALTNKNVDRKILDIIERIDTMKSNENIVNTVSILCKDQKYAKDVMSRFQSRQFLNNEQQLEYNKLIAKLTVLEVTGVIPSIIKENENNSSLLSTVGGAFSSGEVIHYKDISHDEFKYVSKNMMNLFAIVQQLKEKHPDNYNVKRLEARVLQLYNQGYDIKQDGDKVLLTNGTDSIDCYLNPSNSPIFNSGKLDDKLFSIEEVYNMTGGAINYTQAKVLIEFCYYLAEARRQAYDYAGIVSAIMGNTNLNEIIIKDTVAINSKIIDRINNNGYKICESVNLGLEDKYAGYYSAPYQRQLVDLIFNFSTESLEKLLSDRGLTLSYSVISHIPRNKATSKNEYYASSIIDTINFEEIYPATVADKTIDEEKQKLTSDLAKNDISKLYNAFLKLDLSHEDISYYIFNLFISNSYKGKTFEEICNMDNIDEFISNNSTVFNKKVNTLTLRRYLGIFQDMNYVSDSKIVLRDYQQRIKNEVDSIYADNRRFAGVVLPTGGGKSFIAMAEMVDRRDEKIVYLAPRVGILRNFKKNIVEYVAGVDPEGLNEEELDVIVKDCFPYMELICYQSLTATDEAKIASLSADFIIMDEIHHIGGRNWNMCVKQLLDNNKSARILGISATPERDNFVELEGEEYFKMYNGDMMMAISAYLDNYSATELMQKRYLACDINIIDAIQEGYVVCPNIISYDYALDESEDYKSAIRLVNKIKNPLAVAQAKSAIDTMLEAANKAKIVNEDEIISQYLKVNDGRYILLLPRKPREYEGTVDDYFEEMIENFKTAIYDIDKEPHIEYIHSNQTRKLNDAAMQRFESYNDKHMKVLAAIDMLDEGVHLSHLSGSFNYRKIDSKHLILSLQQLGRVIFAIDPNKELTEADIPVVFDKYNNYMNLNFDRLVNKKTVTSDLEKLKEAVFWIEKYKSIPNANSADKHEVRKAVTLIRIREKYAKYKNINLDEQNLNDYDKYNISLIIGICNKYDIWNMNLGTISKEEIRKTERVTLFNVSAIRQTFLEACNSVRNIAGASAMKASDRIKLYLQVADILTENGVVLTPDVLTSNVAVAISDLLSDVDEISLENIKYDLASLGLDFNYPIGIEYEHCKDCFFAGKSVFSGYDYNFEDITNLRKFGILCNSKNRDVIDEQGFIISGPNKIIGKNIWTGTYYFKDNADIKGYNPYGFNVKTKINIHTDDYVDSYGFNIDRINVRTNELYDEHGFDIDHNHMVTGTKLDERNFDIDGYWYIYNPDTDTYENSHKKYDLQSYDIEGFNKRNFNSSHLHKITKLPYDEMFFDEEGYYWALQPDGSRVKTNNIFNEEMFDREGNVYVYDNNGKLVKKGQVYNKYGFMADGTHYITKTNLDERGYDMHGIWHRKNGSIYVSTGSIFNDKGWTRDDLTLRHNAYGLTIDSKGNLLLDKVDDYGFDVKGRYHRPKDEIDKTGFKSFHPGYINYSDKVMDSNRINGVYYDIHGFDKNGISIETGTFLDKYGFDRQGYWWKKDENVELVNTYNYFSDEGWTVDEKKFIPYLGLTKYSPIDSRGFNIDHVYREEHLFQDYDKHFFDYYNVNLHTGTYLDEGNFDVNGDWWKQNENGELVNTHSKYNDEGWNIDHVNERTGHIVDEHGFDYLHLYNYYTKGKYPKLNSSLYDRRGFDYLCIHRKTKKVYDTHYFDIDGFWYKKVGDEYVKTDSKFDDKGYDCTGYDANGFSRNGFSKSNRRKYNFQGFGADCLHYLTHKPYDLEGLDINGNKVADVDYALIERIKRKLHFESRKYLKELLEEYNIRKMLNEIVSIYDESTEDFEEDAGEIDEFIQVIMQLAIKEDNTLYTEDEIYEFLKMYARDAKEQQKDKEIFGSIKEDEYGEITFIDDSLDAIAFGRR